MSTEAYYITYCDTECSLHNTRICSEDVLVGPKISKGSSRIAKSTSTGSASEDEYLSLSTLSSVHDTLTTNSRKEAQHFLDILKQNKCFLCTARKLIDSATTHLCVTHLQIINISINTHICTASIILMKPCWFDVVLTSSIIGLV